MRTTGGLAMFRALGYTLAALYLLLALALAAFSGKRKPEAGSVALLILFIVTGVWVMAAAGGM